MKAAVPVPVMSRVQGAARVLVTPTVLALVLLSILTPERADAHGVSWRRLDAGEAVAVQVGFSGGAPAAYAAVLVHAPGEPDLEFQNGRTDARGRFVFLPDAPGTWRVAVDAGMGHRVAFEVEVGGEAGSEGAENGAPQASAPGEVPPWLGAILGVSLLVNVGFSLTWYRSRMR